jgi:mannosyltransferase
MFSLKQLESGISCRTARIAVAFFLCAGLCLRLYALGRQSLWLDEMTSIQVARMPLAMILKGEVFDNYTPPLYYVLLHFWSLAVPLTEAGIRLLSALIDGVNMVLLAALCSRLLDRAGTVLVVAGYSLSPFMIYYSQEGRMYSLVVLWVLLHALALERVATGKEDGTASIRVWAALSGVALALGTYTHYYFAFFGVGTVSLALYVSRNSRRRVVAILAGTTLAVLLFLPWIPVAARIAATGSQGFRKYVLEVIPYTFFRFTVGYGIFPINADTKDNFVREIISHLPTLSMVFVPLGLLVHRIAHGIKQDGRGFAFSTSWVLFVPWFIGLLLSLRSPMLSERYLVPTFPFFLLLLLGRTPRKEILDKAAIGLFFLLSIAGTAAYFTNPDFGKAQWREVGKQVEQSAHNGDVVVVEPAHAIGVFRYYFAGNFPVLPSPRNISLSGSEEVVERVSAALKGNARVILVSSGMRRGEGYRKDLSLVAERTSEMIYPKETGVTCTIWKMSP